MDAEKMLKHMAWANSEILALVAAMPDKALDSHGANKEWTAREIIHHVVRSAHFLGYRLQMRTPEDAHAGEVHRNAYMQQESAPNSGSDVLALIESLKKADQALLEESFKDDAIVYRVVDGKLIERARSTIISQAIHHATEHRAQLVSALEAGGYSTINLDDFDLWAFADKFGE